MQDLEDLGDRPEEPQPGDCCGSGCARCVWDVYFDNLSAYEARRARGCVKRQRDTTPCSSVSGSTKNSSGGYVGGVVLKYEPDEYDGYERDEGPSAHWRLQFANNIVQSNVVGCRRPATLSHSTDESSLTDDTLRLVRLTIPDEKTVVGDIEQMFRPSDVVEVFVPNEESAVLDACRLFGVPPTRTAVFNVSGYVDPGHFPPWLPKRRIVTMTELFGYYVDLTSRASIHRPLFDLFRQCCPVTAEESVRTQLVHLAESPAGAIELLRESSPTVIDVLRALPVGGVPPLAKFLELSAPLRPRKFSVVDWRRDETKNVSEVTLCIRQAMWRRHETKLMNGRVLLPQISFGHATTALCQLVPPPCWVTTALLGKGVLSVAFLKRPIIMIGAGSGIAPLLAILRQPSNQFRWLIHGQRTMADAAWPLQQALMGSMQQQGRRRYDACVTRESVTPGSTVSLVAPHTTEGEHSEATLTMHSGRVPPFLESMKETIVDEWQKGAGIFVCGPAAFVDSVRTTVASVLYWAEGGGSGEEGADESVRMHPLRMAEAAGDFVVESWSSH